MSQYAAVYAVDGAVAFIGDDEVEVARREIAVLGDHRLQGGDHDPLGAIEVASGSQYMAGIIPQMVGESVLGLTRQCDPIDQEEDASNDARLEQPLDEGRRRARLAGSGRHLHQQFAPPARYLGGKRFDTFDLVIAVDDFSVDGSVRQIAAQLADGDSSFQIVLRIKPRNLPRMGIALAIQKPHAIAIRQKNEWHLHLLGIMLPLPARRNGVNPLPLRLQRRHRPPGSITQRIVGARAIGQRVLELNARAVTQIPVGILQQGIDLGARAGFRHVATVVIRRWRRPLAGNPICVLISRGRACKRVFILYSGSWGVLLARAVS